MSPRLLVSILLVACSKPPASPPPQQPAPAESVPREVAQLGGDRDGPNIVITGAGVYVGHDKLGRVAEGLALAHSLHPEKKTVVFATATAQVPAIVETLRGVRKAGWVRAELYVFDGDSRHLLCDANWDDPATDPAASVTLSIELARDRTWVGISRVDEFQEIPNKAGAHDLEKLATLLKEHHGTAFFVDRHDVELAFAPEVTTAEALGAIQTACNAEFNAPRLVAPDELAARAKP